MSDPSDPSMLTRGLVCVGLALAVGALRAAPLSAGGSGGRLEERIDATGASAGFPPETASSRSAALSSRALDPEAFKRPRVDRHPAS